MGGVEVVVECVVFEGELGVCDGLFGVYLGDLFW